MNFGQKLDTIVNKNNSLLCIGLDTETEKLPSHIKTSPSPLFTFNKAIIDATKDMVCCYKINSAFYEAEGVDGIKQLQQTFAYIREHTKDIPVILDGKRADIGNTNKGYVTFAFDILQADAVTVHPYLGSEALLPFLEKADKGIIVLCKTSNKGAGEIQDLMINDKPLYKVVAKKVVETWNKNNNCLLVVGATYPEEIKEIRKIVGNMFLLVPGVGAQGGDLENTLKNGLTAEKSGLIIHSARGIIYASDGEDFAEKAKQKAETLKNTINRYR